MKRKQRSANEKFRIVLEGLKSSDTVADLCSRHQIARSQYYKWRDDFLKNGTKVFDPSPDKQVERLQLQNRKLTTMLGELHIELKKTEDELKWLGVE